MNLIEKILDKIEEVDFKKRKIEDKMEEFFAEVSKDLAKEDFNLHLYKQKLEKIKEFFLKDCDE